MNAGQQVLDFLYSTQLQVDDEWAVRTPKGFTWWAAECAQTAEIHHEETDRDGATAYVVGVRTDMVGGVELTDAALTELNDTMMRFASMSGPVYDPVTNTLSLCCMGRVTDENEPWMGMLLSTAAVLQLAEVHLFGHVLAEHFGGHLAISGHPDRGVRQEPDEMALAAVRLFDQANRQPLQLQESDFAAAIEQCMKQPPSLGASGGGLGLTVEFPYGGASSLCQFFGDQDHPLFGNGLLFVQRFPYRAPSQADGIRMALDLNRADLTENPAGWGLGSYVYADDMICFNGFLPNMLLRNGVLPSLYYSCAARAFSMSVRLLGQGWDDDGLSLDNSAIGRMMRDDG